MPPDYEKRFDKLEEMHQQTLDILKGENGEAGLCEKVRTNSKALKRLYGAFIFCGGAIVIQAVSRFWNWVESLFTQ